ncbi:glycosyltransferase family 4 protein [Photorhabdus heterorhabditis]|uniref:glycosyltransferase family 4 protein n=1 Tax=Photorhabdus heterorhabditis TaxID=880156 RepID=UPI001BD39DE4|nr:glycosyltransferase family 4 protein [Photorhabdus heterorhabditis]MBS9442722.1 glycosyltransferase [Photorhabdus heterorhabditis]
MKIAHMTSVHSRYDTRIFFKECISLQQEKYDVSLIVADGRGNETNKNINIYDVGFLPGRLNRIFRTTKLVYKKACELSADIYHLHDPELIPIGLKLLKKNKIVIFDAHEDVPKQLLSKPYLNKYILRFLSKGFSLYERWAIPKFSGIITATPIIRDKFLLINKRTIDINNYPILGELHNSNIEWSEKEKQVCYVGGISRIRGIKEMIESISHLSTDTKMKLAGNFSNKDLENKIKSMKNWHKIDELGFLNRTETKELLSKSIAGMVLFHPQPNHIDAQPNKMFEYMSAGIPVIASNFTLWKDIIIGNNCGICIDPLNPKELAHTIDYLSNNHDIAEEMGNNGCLAVNNKYNWNIEQSKLIKFYQQIRY